MSLGIDNNNPGNIEYDGTDWLGLEGRGRTGRFCRFKTPAHGIRAMCRVLITYQSKRKAADGSRIDTVAEVVTRWAPPTENDTQSYIKSVRKRAGFEPGEIIDVHDYDDVRPLIEALIYHENGKMPYSEAQLRRGIMLAGIEPPEEPKSRTVKAAQVTAGATGFGMLAQATEQIETTAPLLERFAQYGPYALGGIALLAVCAIIWFKMQDKAEGRMV